MLFKILHGDESRISTDITPFHEGWAYVTTSGNFYIDMNIGTVEVPNNQRIKLNAKDTETITGVSLEELRNEFANQSIAILAEAQIDSSNKVAVVLAEAQQAITTEQSRAESAEAALESRVDELEALDHEAYKGYVDGLNAEMSARVEVLEAIDHEAYIGAIDAVKSELQTDASNKAIAILAEAQKNIETIVNNKADKISTISLPASNWMEATNIYSQVVAVVGATANSKVDICPAPEQLVELQNAGITLVAVNEDGVVTVYAMNNKPTVDYAMQVTLTEVNEGV